jgi:hypothetical protein
MSGLIMFPNPNPAGTEINVFRAPLKSLRGGPLVKTGGRLLEVGYLTMDWKLVDDDS